MSLITKQNITPITHTFLNDCSHCEGLAAEMRCDYKAIVDPPVENVEEKVEVPCEVDEVKCKKGEDEEKPEVDTVKSDSLRSYGYYDVNGCCHNFATREEMGAWIECNPDLIEKPEVALYVGAGWETTSFEADWAIGATIHAIDIDPSPRFMEKVMDMYTCADFDCSDADRKELEDHTGTRRVVRFYNEDRDTTIMYHFNSGLPDQVKEIAATIGPYQGFLCSGIWPPISAMDEAFNIPDYSLTFRGYAHTPLGVDDSHGIPSTSLDDMAETVPGRLCYDYAYRRKFCHYEYYDVNDECHDFDTWEELLVWLRDWDNSDLAFG